MKRHKINATRAYLIRTRPYDHRDTSLLPSGRVVFLSVVNDEGCADVIDAVAEEVATGRTIGDCAAIVQVICPSAAVTFGIAAGLQHHVFRDVVVLIAVGAGKVETDDPHEVLAHLGNRELTDN